MPTRSFITRLLAVTCVTVLLTAPSVIAFDPATQFLAEWGEDLTFVEWYDPLARYDEFPVDDEDGNGIPDAEHVPFIPDHGDVVGGTGHMTNARIKTEIQRFGYSKTYLNAQITRILGWQPAWETRRAEAVAAVNADDFTRAVELMTGTAADVTFYCGPQGNPVAYHWVAVIPFAMDCDTDILEEVSVVTEVRFVHADSAQEDLERPEDVEFLFTNIGTDPLTTTPRHVIGVEYFEHGFGAWTNSQNTWTMKFNVDDMDEVPGWHSGSVEFDTPVGRFAEGDGFVYSLEGKLTRGYSVTTTPVTDTTDPFKLDFKSHVGTPEDREVEVRPTEPSLVERYDTYADLGDHSPGHVWQCEMKAAPEGVVISYTHWVEEDAGIKRDLVVRNPSAAEPHEMEYRCTYRVDAQERVSWHAVGMPARADLRLDLGDADDAIASADLTKAAQNVKGRFRSAWMWFNLTLTDQWEYQGNDVNRVRVVTGPADPRVTDEDVRLRMLGAVLGKYNPDSMPKVTLEGRHLNDLALPAEYAQSLTRVSGNALEYAVTASPECEDTCTGVLPADEDTNVTAGGTRYSFWSIPKTSLPWSICKIRHGDGACA